VNLQLTSMKFFNDLPLKEVPSHFANFSSAKR
jgi:hypothetical protein